jgi:hypothetical protein
MHALYIWDLTNQVTVVTNRIYIWLRFHSSCLCMFQYDFVIQWNLATCTGSNLHANGNLWTMIFHIHEEECSGNLWYVCIRLQTKLIILLPLCITLFLWTHGIYCLVKCNVMLIYPTLEICPQLLEYTCTLVHHALMHSFMFHSWKSLNSE